jgi:hypothetical protein
MTTEVLAFKVTPVCLPLVYVTLYALLGVAMKDLEEQDAENGDLDSSNFQRNCSAERLWLSVPSVLITTFLLF